jgi:hypothetical protein
MKEITYLGDEPINVRKIYGAAKEVVQPGETFEVDELQQKSLFSVYPKLFVPAEMADLYKEKKKEKEEIAKKNKAFYEAEEKEKAEVYHKCTLLGFDRNVIAQKTIPELKDMIAKMESDATAKVKEVEAEEEDTEVKKGPGRPKKEV